MVSIATATIVSLSHDQALSIRKAARTQANERALTLAAGLEDYARIILRKDRSKTKADDLNEDWAVGIPPLPVEGGFVVGQLTDEQSKINLNAINRQEVEDRLRRLCDNLDQSCDFIPALKDWIDTDSDLVDGDGAEDEYYTALQPAYRAANRELVDISELQLIKGFNDEVYNALQPHVTVLPGDTSLNLNTISGEIYETLDKGLDTAQFLQQREDEPFQDLQDYSTRMKHTIAATDIGVSTNYFLADGQVNQGEKNLYFSTLIHRDDKGATQIITRQFRDFP